MTETTIKIQLLQLLQQDTNTIYFIKHSTDLMPNIMHYISFIEVPKEVVSVQGNDSSFKKAIFKAIENMLRVGLLKEHTYIAAHKIIYDSL